MTRSGYVQSIARGVDVMELVARSGAGIRLCDVAQAIGVKPPTAHSILKTLSLKGLVTRAGTRYTTGPLLQELVRLQESRSLLRAAEVAMRRLTTCIPDADISLADYSTGEVRIVLRLRAGTAPVLQKPQSLVYNPYVTASGLLFLALGDPDAVAQLQARQPFLEFGVHVWKVYSRLEEFLALAREEGSVIRPFCEPDHFAVAVPVHDPGKGPAAALGASVSRRVSSASERGDIIERLKQAAGAIADHSSQYTHLSTDEEKGATE